MATTPEKILVRGVNWLGDAVMSTPALARLREAKPNAEIVLLTPEKLSGLWDGHPAINRVITFTPAESVLSVDLTSNITSPPLPPSPPSGPPNGINFSRRKCIMPSPPFPDLM